MKTTYFNHGKILFPHKSAKFHRAPTKGKAKLLHSRLINIGRFDSNVGFTGTPTRMAEEGTKLKQRETKRKTDAEETSLPTADARATTNWWCGVGRRPGGRWEVGG